MDLNQTQGFTVGPVAFHSAFILESRIDLSQAAQRQAGTPMSFKRE